MTYLGIFGGCLGSLFVIAIFTGVPAYMLGVQYNLAVGLAYASISGTLLSIFWNTNKMVKDQ